MTETILVRCQTCGSEGRLYRTEINYRRIGDPYHEIDCGPCPDCDGTGAEEVPAVPLTEEECHAASLSAYDKGDYADGEI